MNSPARLHFDAMTPAQQAGILCNDAQFQRFVTDAHAYPGDAASFVRGWCDIKSRRDLNTSKPAAARFQSLRTAFDAWRGKIATQR